MSLLFNPAYLKYNYVSYKRFFFDPISALKHKSPNVLKINDFYMNHFLYLYFVGLFKAVYIKEWVLKFVDLSGSISSAYTKIRFPVIFGDGSVYSRGSCLYVLLKYYLDLDSFSSGSIVDLSYLIGNAVCYFKRFLGLQVKVINFNYWFFLINRIRNIMISDVVVDGGGHGMSTNFAVDDHLINNTVRHSKGEAEFDVRSISLKRSAFVYRLIIKQFHAFSANRYFLRILNPFFSAFSARVFDIQLIVNCLAFEFSNLRRKHYKFIRFIFPLLSSLFSVFSRNCGISGLKLSIKGRLIPHNRENPRGILKVLRLGKLNASDFNFKSSSAVARCASRYGSINIALNISKLSGVYSSYGSDESAYIKNVCSSVVDADMSSVIKAAETHVDVFLPSVSYTTNFYQRFLSMFTLYNTDMGGVPYFLNSLFFDMFCVHGFTKLLPQLTITCLGSEITYLLCFFVSFLHNSLAASGGTERFRVHSDIHSTCVENFDNDLAFNLNKNKPLQLTMGCLLNFWPYNFVRFTDMVVNGVNDFIIKYVYTGSLLPRMRYKLFNSSIKSVELKSRFQCGSLHKYWLTVFFQMFLNPVRVLINLFEKYWLESSPNPYFNAIGVNVRVLSFNGKNFGLFFIELIQLLNSILGLGIQSLAKSKSVFLNYTHSNVNLITQLHIVPVSVFYKLFAIVNHYLFFKNAYSTLLFYKGT